MWGVKKMTEQKETKRLKTRNQVRHGGTCHHPTLRRPRQIMVLRSALATQRDSHFKSKRKHVFGDLLLCVLMYVHMHVGGRGWHWVSSSVTITILAETGSFIGSSSSRLRLHSARVSAAYHNVWFLHSAGDESWVLMNAQALYQLSHLQSLVTFLVEKPHPHLALVRSYRWMPFCPLLTHD